MDYNRSDFVKYFYFSLTIFSLGVFVRVLTNTPLLNQIVVENNFELLEFQYDFLDDSMKTFLYIFSNNLILNIALILSFVFLCVSNIFILFFNGFLLGNSIMVAYYSGISFGQIVLLTLTHGLTELFALFLSSSLSFIIMIALYKYINNEQKIKKTTLIKWGYIAIGIFTLTFLSAMIETFITVEIFALPSK